MYRIGIDLGGTNIAVGLVDDSNYTIVAKKSLPTNAHRAPEAIVDDMAKLCRDVCEEADISISDVTSIGIATPGIANNDTGVVEYANNLPFKNFPIVALLRERTKIKTINIENDANAAAWGEAVAGAAKGTDTSIMVTLGTGVGGGIIINNKIFSGFNHTGAEIGHIVIEKGGVPCTCGRAGCWEAYSSATALIRMTSEKIEECRREGRDSVMLSAQKISGRTACDAMREGDTAGKEVYDKYIAYLATGIANMINIFHPEVISLGGGVSNEGQSLVDDLLPLIRKNHKGANPEAITDIRIAKLGNDAGIIGAAAL